jgi:hypothetical protein
MERTLAEIRADIARLREHAAKYRQLEEERRARDHGRIADKLADFVRDLEGKAAEMEATLRKLSCEGPEANAEVIEKRPDPRRAN